MKRVRGPLTICFRAMGSALRSNTSWVWSWDSTVIDDDDSISVLSMEMHVAALMQQIYPIMLTASLPQRLIHHAGNHRTNKSRGAHDLTLRASTGQHILNDIYDRRPRPVQVANDKQATVQAVGRLVMLGCLPAHSLCVLCSLTAASSSHH